MPIAVDVSYQIEEFCGVLFTSSDQNIDTTNSQMRRDNINVEKCSNWFEYHDPPFTCREAIMCNYVSTGRY